MKQGDKVKFYELHSNGYVVNKTIKEGIIIEIKSSIIKVRPYEEDSKWILKDLIVEIVKQYKTYEI